MYDFARIVGFEWDEGNGRKSLDRHGVSQAEAEQIFLDPRLLVLTDDKHSGNENRFHAYGATASERLLLVSFTIRGNDDLTRVISARDMSRKESNRYAEEV